MPSEAFDWMIRLKAIEREYKMVRLSMDRLEQQAQDDPHVLAEGLRFRDIGAVSGPPVTLRDATNYLSTFLSWLQRTW